MSRLPLRTSSFLALVLVATGCGQILGLDSFVAGKDVGAGGDTGSGGGTGQGGGGTSSTGQGGDMSVPLEVTAESAKMGILRAQTLTANKEVTWSVEGGDANGRIDADGRYMSPATPGDYTVVATATDGSGESVTTAIRVVPLGIEIVTGKAGGRGTLGGSLSRARFEEIRGIGAASQPLVSDNTRLRRVNSNEVTTIAGVLYPEDAPIPVPTADEIQLPSVMAGDYNGDNFWIASADGTCIRKLAVGTNKITPVAGECRSSDGIVDAANGAETRFDSIGAIVLESSRDLLFVCDAGQLRQVRLATGKTTTIKEINSFGVSSAIGCSSLGVLDYMHLAVSTYGNGQAIIKSVPIYYDGINDEDEVRVECADAAATYCVRSIGTTIGTDMAYVSYDKFIYSTNGSEIQRCTWNEQKQSLDSCDVILKMDSTNALVDGVLGAAEKPTIYRASQLASNAWDLYWADNSTVLRALVNGKTVSTITGSMRSYQSIDGDRATARISGLFALSMGKESVGYFSEFNDYEGGYTRIRSFDVKSGAIAHLSGGPWNETDPLQNGAADVATHAVPMAMLYRGDFVYVADIYANAVRRISTTDGVTEDFAGMLQTPGYIDAPGTEARFNFMDGQSFIVAMVADDKYLYVSDPGNHAIRRITLGEDGGKVDTLAGGKASGNNNGVGEDAQFVSPGGLAYDNGKLYVADSGSKLIRQIDVDTGEVTNLVGVLDSVDAVDGAYGVGSFRSIFNLAADGIGNLYVTDMTPRGYAVIRRVDIAKQEIFPFAGSLSDAGLVPGALPGTLNVPINMTVDVAGDLVFGDSQDSVIAVIRPL